MSWPPGVLLGAGWHLGPLTTGGARFVSGRQVCITQGRAGRGPAQTGWLQGLKCGRGLRACGTKVSGRLAGPKHTSPSDQPRGPCSLGAWKEPGKPEKGLQWGSVRRRGRCVAPVGAGKVTAWTVQAAGGGARSHGATWAVSRLGAALRDRSDWRHFPNRHCHSRGQAQAWPGAR